MINNAGITLVNDSLIKVSKFDVSTESKVDHIRLFKEVEAIYKEMCEINPYLFSTESSYWFCEYKQAYNNGDTKKILDNMAKMSMRYLAQQLHLIKSENNL